MPSILWREKGNGEGREESQSFGDSRKKGRERLPIVEKGGKKGEARVKLKHLGGRECRKDDKRTRVEHDIRTCRLGESEGWTEERGPQEEGWGSRRMRRGR